MRITFTKHPNVIAGISERKDSSMVWWNRLPVAVAIKKNRDDYFQRQGLDPRQVVSAGLVHGNKVTKVSQIEAGVYLQNTDALITNTPNLFLSITIADCLPVFFFDPVSSCIGIAHAGWRGIVAGILEKTVQEMEKVFHVQPKNLMVKVGPHIQVCHFEVGPEVAEQFQKENIEQREGKLFVNLGKESQKRLEKVGVHDIHIDSSCTYHESHQFYSARHDKVDPLEGMLAYIGIK